MLQRSRKHLGGSGHETSPALAMDSTDSSLLEAMLSDDNDTRNEAEVSAHDDLIMKKFIAADISRRSSAPYHSCHRMTSYNIMLNF